MNAFDDYYNSLITNEKVMRQHVSLGRDFALFNQRYLDDPISLLNPIPTEEMKNLYIYFDSYGSEPITVKQIFTDFYVKYVAIRFGLHFLVGKMVFARAQFFEIQETEYYSLSETFGEIANHILWFFNLLMERQEFYLKNGLNKINTKKTKKLSEAIEAFINVGNILKELLAKMLPARIQDRNFAKLSNPYIEKMEDKNIFPKRARWEQIIQAFAEYRNLDASLIDRDDTTLTREEINSPEKYIKLQHDLTWDVLDHTLSKDLQTLMGFFYTMFTGEKYIKNIFSIKPSYEGSKKIWYLAKELYHNVMLADPNVKRSIKIGNRPTEYILRSNVIEILRICMNTVEKDEQGWMDISLNSNKIGFNIISCEGQIFNCDGDFKIETYRDISKKKPDIYPFNDYNKNV